MGSRVGNKRVMGRSKGLGIVKYMKYVKKNIWIGYIIFIYFAILTPWTEEKGHKNNGQKGKEPKGYRYGHKSKGQKGRGQKGNGQKTKGREIKSKNESVKGKGQWGKR